MFLLIKLPLCGIFLVSVYLYSGLIFGRRGVGGLYWGGAYIWNGVNISNVMGLWTGVGLIFGGGGLLIGGLRYLHLLPYFWLHFEQFVIFVAPTTNASLVNAALSDHKTWNSTKVPECEKVCNTA